MTTSSSEGTELGFASRMLSTSFLLPVQQYFLSGARGLDGAAQSFLLSDLHLSNDRWHPWRGASVSPEQTGTPEDQKALFPVIYPLTPKACEGSL